MYNQLNQSMSGLNLKSIIFRLYVLDTKKITYQIIKKVAPLHNNIHSLEEHMH